MNLLDVSSNLARRLVVTRLVFKLANDETPAALPKDQVNPNITPPLFSCDRGATGEWRQQAVVPLDELGEFSFVLKWKAGIAKWRYRDENGVTELHVV